VANAEPREVINRIWYYWAPFVIVGEGGQAEPLTHPAQVLWRFLWGRKAAMTVE
jgi:hypothetical protein